MPFRARIFIAIFWLASAATVAVLAWQGPAWWDTDVYWTAIRSVERGGDPYAEGVARQHAFQESRTDVHAKPPMTYVYSPLTLPLLRALGHVPARVLGAGYYTALLGGFLLQLWAAWKMALPHEQRVLPYLFPAAAFFPGLLNDDVLLSGNVVYLLYGLVLAAAVPGWQRNRWRWYYVAVLAASCFKAPLLSLLLLPVLFGEEQWWNAGATGIAGIFLFASQAWIWPRLFAEYLQAVNLQFVLNDDFGFGPAGLLGSALWRAGLPYSMGSQALYLLTAAAVFAALWFARRRIGGITEAKVLWLPTVLAGTILLNPRVKEYDVAPLTIPLFLITWRAIRAAQIAFVDWRHSRHPFVIRDAGRKRLEGDAAAPMDWSQVLCVAGGAGWFLAINFASGGGAWKPIELSVLLAAFALGNWTSRFHASRARAQCADYVARAADIILQGRKTKSASSQLP